MRYQWHTADGSTVSVEQLAAFTAAHAHDFYEAAGRFTVTEPDGHVASGGGDSVYREDAFETAAAHYGVSYDVFYDAWLAASPVDHPDVAAAHA